MAVVVFSGLGGVDFKSKSIAVLTQESVWSLLVLGRAVL